MKYEFKGLTEQKIKQSRKEHGSNVITPQDVESFWDKLWDNFKDPMIVILVVALAIITILAVMGYAKWYEGVGIAAAVAVATFVATISEYKNEQTFQKLQEEASKIMVNVFRNGGVKIIGIDDVVVGDQILLNPGDKIPADGKILQGKIKVNQATFTGEAESVTKKLTDTTASNDDFENPNSLYRGTTVEDGEAVMEVQIVGDETQLGKLTRGLTKDDREGPLRVKLSKLAGDITRFGYIGAIFIAVAFMFKAIYLDNSDGTAMLAYLSNWHQLIYDLATATILAVIIIVVAVPEGLPMMIAIVLSQNMRKLLNSNVLVRQLLGIETAGSLNILFCDKTGTITKGQLEAINFLSFETKDSISLNSYDNFDAIPKKLKQLLDLSLRENSSCVINPSEQSEKANIVGGNMTEKALLKFIQADQQNALSGGAKTLQQILFNTKRKFSACQIETQDGQKLTLAKGAPGRILESCSSCYDSEGNVQPLSQTEKETLFNNIDERSMQGFRIIAIAISEKETWTEQENNLPDGLSLLGFVSIRDDLREEAKSAIESLHSAGVRVVMLTGDRMGTAKAIAKDAGLLPESDYVAFRSSEMAALSDEELKSVLPRLRIVSRCLPEDKTRLVKIAQSAGCVVGMTGDGVNDSPALINSDVGFSMGSGTEVAKEASHIVVMNDNIISIATAVHYGRTIYRSIQKFITFQLTVNVSAILVAFLGPFLGYKLPLTMIQLLWVNLIMDTLAALAFSGEPPLSKHMAEPPKKREENIITRDMWSSILFNGIFIAMFSMVFLKLDYIYSLFHSREAFLTAFFGFFVFINNFNKFNVRVEEINLFDHILKNKGFLKVVFMIFSIQVLLTYFGGAMFRTVALQPMEWVYITIMAFAIVPFDLARKSIMHK